MGTAPVTALMGIFGSAHQKNAAKAAMQMLEDARRGLISEGKDLTALFKPFISQSQQAFQTASSQNATYNTMLQDFIRQTQGMDTGVGLSAADQIAMKDAERLMNENFSQTGNLRSGAAGYANVELARRTAADAAQRSFQRNLDKMQLLFGGTQQGFGSAAQNIGLGQSSGQIGYAGTSLGTNLLQQAYNLVPLQAQARLNLGAAQAGQLTSIGRFSDEVKDTLREGQSDMMGMVSAVMGGAGAAMGGAGAMGATF